MNQKITPIIWFQSKEMSLFVLEQCIFWGYLDLDKSKEGLLLKLLLTTMKAYCCNRWSAKVIIWIWQKVYLFIYLVLYGIWGPGLILFVRSVWEKEGPVSFGSFSKCCKSRLFKKKINKCTNFFLYAKSNLRVSFAYSSLESAYECTVFERTRKLSCD